MVIVPALISMALDHYGSRASSVDPHLAIVFPSSHYIA
jgi:hypothetical protein